MASTDLTEGEVERPLRHLKSGKMTDFTLRLRDKEWKGHGIVLSRVSNFFSKACAGEFQEANTKIVELHDDSACMLARLVLFCYVGKYPSPNTAEFLQPELEELAEDGKDGDLTVHAAMYGMGDKYDISALKKFSKDSYVHTLECIMYSVSDFIQSILVDFTTTAETDEELRKWVVWEAQKYGFLLWDYANFEDFNVKAPDFIRDLLTKYARGSFVWCGYCEERDAIQLTKYCKCGFNSMCERSEYCKNPQLLLEHQSCEFCMGREDLKIVDQAMLRNADAGTIGGFLVGLGCG